MIGHAKTPYAAMHALMRLLASSGITPQWIADRIDRDLTHRTVPPALRRAPAPGRLSALDQALAAAAEYERRHSPADVRYIEELW